MILHHPSSVILPEADRPVPSFQGQEPGWSPNQVRAYMRANSLRGASPLSASVNVRTPFVGELKTITLPDDVTTVTVKRCGNRENIQRKNLASTVRYVEEMKSGRFVSEKDYPVGDLELETLFLGMHGWNICDSNKNPVPVTRENLTIYLSPAEFDLVYREVLKINPMWTNGGEAEVKKD